MSEDQDNLKTRVEELEAQLAGIKRVGLLALILLGMVGFFLVNLSRSEMKGVTTQGIVLQDGAGEFAGALTVADSGHMALVPVNVRKDLPALTSYPNLDLRGLGVYDSQGRVRIVLGVDANDVPVMAVLGEDGKATWTPLNRPAARPSAPPPSAPMNPAPPAPTTPAPSATP